MNILQTRYLFGDDFTLSRLLIDGQLVPDCIYILEDKVREAPSLPVPTWKVPNETAIPVGTYKVEVDMSRRFKKLMMHLLDVPGFSGVRIHAGNTSHDTEGCLITGRFADEKEGRVWGSKDARDVLFNLVFGAISQGEPVWWTVQGLPEGENHG